MPTNPRNTYLPEVLGRAGSGVRPSKMEEPKGKYPCPCCGCITLPVPEPEALAYICPVCFWEVDTFLQSEDEPSDQNHGLTLRQCRENYKTIGACCKEMLPHVRRPLPEERNNEE